MQKLFIGVILIAGIGVALARTVIHPINLTVDVPVSWLGTGADCVLTDPSGNVHRTSAEAGSCYFDGVSTGQYSVTANQLDQNDQADGVTVTDSFWLNTASKPVVQL
jgi:hypothetical protein